MNLKAEKKREQMASVILRTYVLQSILYNNFSYSFVIGNRKRKPHVGLSYYPIQKIFDEQNLCIFNSTTTEVSGKDKNKYLQRFIVEFMRKELEKFGYQFKMKENPIKKESICLHKIYSFEWVGNDMKKFNFDMKILENTLGLEFYTMVDESFGQSGYSCFIFDGNNSLEIKIRGVTVKRNEIFVYCLKQEVAIESNYLESFLGESK